MSTKPPRRKDLVGQVFNRLTVMSTAPNRPNKRAYWVCKCECGRETISSTNDLKQDRIRSCGCLQAETRIKANTKHGFNGSRTYVSWCSMLARCTNEKLRSYKNYGGRGIVVCSRWMEFENFLADMGERPEKHSIDRIDNDGNYEPGNCRWATASEQRKNQRPRAAAAIGKEQS